MKEEDREEYPKIRGLIQMIFGGPTDGDSNRASRARARRGKQVCQVSAGEAPIFGFGPSNPRGLCSPHNDALVITAEIGGCKVQRIFIDNGSTANIIIKECDEKMSLEVELRK